MLSNLINFVLSNATCTSSVGTCYVYPNKIVVDVGNQCVNTLSVTISAFGCSETINLPINCCNCRYIVVYFGEHSK